MKIISGGQAGVDRAALDVALELGLEHGGWCPKGRKAEDGPIPEKYQLQETASYDYRVRTMLNVAESDATLIICFNEDDVTGGTLLTLNEVRRKKKLHVIIFLESDVEGLPGWSHYNKIGVLNVAGPRESKSPGIYLAARKFLLEALK